MTVYRFDGWKLDTDRRALFAPDGRPVHLTKISFELLRTFCEHPREVLSMKAIQPKASAARLGSVRVMRLRDKIEPSGDPSLIVTVHGEGYFFTPEVTTE